MLEQELRANTFASGVNREMAFDYHGFVAELAVVAAAEASWAGRALSQEFWERLYRMFDVIAATMDVAVRVPRYGDGDEGRALVLDPPTSDHWSGLLAIGHALFDTPEWWPKVQPTMTSIVLASMSTRRPAAVLGPRPSHYDDAGLTLLRSSPSDGDEIWCRCDAGPHGFLSIAAHAHADALAVEVRHNGVDILADPGTYCYHGEPDWRSYFRSTVAHNTLEVGGCDQSTSGGPFLWSRQARTTLRELAGREDGDVGTWSAEHDGYLSLKPSVLHRRTVRLESQLRQLEIIDRIETIGEHSLRLAFHFGPTIDVRIAGRNAELTWSVGPSSYGATLVLPVGLSWSLHRGETEPILGWYSPSFGSKVPAWALIGRGKSSGTGSDRHTTTLNFHG